MPRFMKTENRQFIVVSLWFRCFSQNYRNVDRVRVYGKVNLIRSVKPRWDEV